MKTRYRFARPKALMHDELKAPPRYVLPGTAGDPDWFAVTFAGPLGPQCPHEAFIAAVQPWNDQARTVVFPCGTEVLIPPHACLDQVAALYARARLDRVLELMNPVGSA